MKYFLVLTPLAFLSAFITGIFPQNNMSAPTPVGFKRAIAIGCSPALSQLNIEENPVSLLKGWGNYRMKVTVTNDSANIYFQQGINLYYSFHIIEALASFEKAIYFDNDFAMGWWGKALALGPNINDMGYAASPAALTAIQNAQRCKKCTPLEQSLVAAMAQRYSGDTAQSREVLNRKYAAAMKQVYRTFPNSADAAALYADALMILHPWDLYDRYYQPKPWTPEIVSVLEKLVKRFPDNPGGSHYYIHAIEGSTHPEKALPVANRLGSMMPGVAHLVHMPSHIYIRSGFYEKGIAVNLQAIKGYNNYLAAYAPVATNGFLYLLHNQHMLAACALMNGQYEQAVEYAAELHNNIDVTMTDAGGFFGIVSQYLDMTGLFVKIRFSKWEDILQEPGVPESGVFAQCMLHFAKGMALAKTRQHAAAENELRLLQRQKTNPQLQESPVAFNPGIAAVNVAEKILEGIIAAENKESKKAVALLREAVYLEDGMLYNEPKDWQLPARHFLGNLLLTLGENNEAEKIFRQDLRINPANPWSLSGLQKALQLQGKMKESKIIQQQLLQNGNAVL